MIINYIGGEQSISFVISVLSVLGMLLLILYTGYGLGALPFYLIKGKKSLSTAHQEYEMDRAQIRERIRSLQEKMSRKGTLTNKEKKELSRLRDDEQSIDKKISRISGLLETDQVFNKVLTVLTPFRVIIGIVFLVLSILILSSLLTTSIDRYLHSKCGLDCGFLLDDKNYTNYLDYLMLYSSRFFHLDYILFAIINLYVFICSLYGFVKLGVKFLIFTWFEIKKQSTNPQGLLIMSFMMCLMILAFMMEMLTLAPQYSTFGTQTFAKNSKQGEIPCQLSLISGAQQKECIMSNISKFYNRISLSLPFFSTIFYVANWLLISLMAISLLYAAFFKKDEDVLDDCHEIDDEEKRILRDD